MLCRGTAPGEPAVGSGMEAIWKSSNERIYLRHRLDFSRDLIPKEPKAQPRTRSQTVPIGTGSARTASSACTPPATGKLRREDLPPLPLERLERLNFNNAVRPLTNGHHRGRVRSLSPERQIDSLVSDGVVLTLLDGGLRIRPNSHHGYRSTEAVMTYWNAFHAQKQNRASRYIK